MYSFQKKIENTIDPQASCSTHYTSPNTSVFRIVDFPIMEKKWSQQLENLQAHRHELCVQSIEAGNNVRTDSASMKIVENLKLQMEYNAKELDELEAMLTAVSTMIRSCEIYFGYGIFQREDRTFCPSSRATYLSNNIEPSLMRPSAEELSVWFLEMKEALPSRMYEEFVKETCKNGHTPEFFSISPECLNHFEDYVKQVQILEGFPSAAGLRAKLEKEVEARSGKW
jgi:hypothetical protein